MRKLKLCENENPNGWMLKKDLEFDINIQSREKNKKRF